MPRTYATTYTRYRKTHRGPSFELVMKIDPRDFLITAAGVTTIPQKHVMRERESSWL